MARRHREPLKGIYERALNSLQQLEGSEMLGRTRNVNNPTFLDGHESSNVSGLANFAIRNGSWRSEASINP